MLNSCYMFYGFLIVSHNYLCNTFAVYTDVWYEYYTFSRSLEMVFFYIIVLLVFEMCCGFHYCSLKSLVFSVVI